MPHCNAVLKKKRVSTVSYRRRQSLKPLEQLCFIVVFRAAGFASSILAPSGAPSQRAATASRKAVQRCKNRRALDRNYTSSTVVGSFLP